MRRTNILLPNRFKGALIGVLVGDCYGARFESHAAVNASAIAEFIESAIIPKEGQDAEPLRFTDDSAMTMATCKSLIKNKGLDTKHLAKAYAETFYKEPNRGYGGAVPKVFSQLRETNYSDPFKPAAEQFNGTGSYGNGAAMRCNGLALFAFKKNLNDRQTLSLVEDFSKITHSHVYGIHGAVLLVCAIRYLLGLDEDTLDEAHFLDHLIKTMQDLEDNQMYTNKLKSIKGIIDQLSISGTDVTQREIVTMLGNDVAAQNSVPLAVYSFLRGISKFTDAYRFENEFVRTLHWAISCGGDTDTIASMACGLSGAYLGLEKIPERLYRNCESWQEMIALADQLAT